jgi:hypothetical protein
MTPATPPIKTKSADNALKPSSKPSTNARTAKTPSAPGLWKRTISFLKDDKLKADIINDEEREMDRFNRALRRIIINAIIILCLGLILVFGMPFFQPIYFYYALNPQNQVMQIAAMTMPNMTNNALLSWATTTTTEIMTMGFGDYEQHLRNQRNRFTEDGWESFTKAFDRQKIGEAFRERQLVLTTVPSNTPVILFQGVNDKNIYQWLVQLPAVLTYATNNGVSHSDKALIELTIVRAPTDKYPAGIAIKKWSREVAK